MVVDEATSPYEIVPLLISAIGNDGSVPCPALCYSGLAIRTSANRMIRLLYRYAGESCSAT